eukprot:6198769-Pleurochrysis_carterae.AAC.1
MSSTQSRRTLWSESSVCQRLLAQEGVQSRHCYVHSPRGAARNSLCSVTNTLEYVRQNLSESWPSLWAWRV